MTRVTGRIDGVRWRRGIYFLESGHVSALMFFIESEFPSKLTISFDGWETYQDGIYASVSELIVELDVATTPALYT